MINHKLVQTRCSIRYWLFSCNSTCVYGDGKYIFLNRTLKGNYEDGGGGHTSSKQPPLIRPPGSIHVIQVPLYSYCEMLVYNKLRW